jgi:hypothetical protein
MVKKLPSFYGTQRFITAFTSATLPILNPFDLVHIPSPYFQKIHHNIILPSTRGSPKWSLSLKFHHQTLYTSLLSLIFITE